ncbi:hypothetical protein V6N12_045157 [Hibiscus sabdariffa]|uniref:Uncharacterized protein n=1 Tax=Hibiscus sabdariffa TaxID=183260 RepID=A0ABR2G1Y5_9ROSI
MAEGRQSLMKRCVDGSDQFQKWCLCLYRTAPWIIGSTPIQWCEASRDWTVSGRLGSSHVAPIRRASKLVRDN